LLDRVQYYPNPSNHQHTKVGVIRPIIFIGNNNIRINEIKKILKENHNQYIYIMNI